MSLNFDGPVSFSNQLLSDLKTRINRKMGSKKKLPWMYSKEIDLLSEALKNLNPKRCLEWGSGFSTVYFPHLLDKDSSWLALEHNTEWFEIVDKSNQNSRVEVVNMPADQEPYTDPKKDGAYDDFKSYIEYPEGKFDFIFIDGRARKDCVKKAFELINDDGLVVLHDANRTHYYDHFELYKHQVLFDDHHKKYGGVWLASKTIPIDNFINVDKHKRVWKRHDVFAKIFKPF
ncbi:hypothetical protein E1176_13175 [Fulvivirga sp. RKSG066]|uniref:class I SAM-dependent methyltransferase n=1 Tax=Fulvivirga aurantia TaxID=2529383 RepID=UPI0012BB7B9A|nr:class I SAM-dependent methyltransferase [Fulvivirga aurantia]MTI21978.1 hypothetical protein [Fulvivirga aurantia]